VLAERGYPVHERAAYRYFVGEGVEKLLFRALPAAARAEPTLSACIDAFRADYARTWHVHTRPYPGVPELLAAATARGLKLAVLSNKPHEFTTQCVERLLAGARFDIVRGATAAFPRKPDPSAALHIARTLDVSPSAVLYVGDTATDMATAQAAGMYPLGVLWGFREADELQSAGAKALAHTPADILTCCLRQ